MEFSNRKYIESNIKRVAQALGDLNHQVVYVGGSVVSLYIDDPAAEDARPTKDIDIFLEIVTYGKLTKLQDELAKRRIFPAQDEEIMCRFRYEDILIDIMSTTQIGWASADKWFGPGLKMLEIYRIDDVNINILHISYFLASKFNALFEREEDARISRHFEDIIYILDNKIDLVHKMSEAPEDVRFFLIQQFRELVTDKYKEAILGHLPFKSQMERFEILKGKLTTIINSYNQ